MISQEKQDDYFSTGTEMWERASKVYELVDNYYANKKDEDLDEESNALTELNREITELKKEKVKLIKIAIGYMYDGVLVAGDISCRRGEVYRFRCQYGLRVEKIKESIEKSLHEVAEKLTPTNLTILESILELINDKDEKDQRYSNYGYGRGDNDNNKVLVLDNPLRVAEFEKDYGVTFKVIKKIKIGVTGDMTYESLEDRETSLERYTRDMIKAKMSEELKDLASEFVKSQTEVRDTLQSDIQTIKSKAVNLLMLAEINKQI